MMMVVPKTRIGNEAERKAEWKSAWIVTAEEVPLSFLSSSVKTQD